MVEHWGTLRLACPFLHQSTELGVGHPSELPPRAEDTEKAMEEGREQRGTESLARETGASGAPGKMQGTGKPNTS